VIPKYGPSCGSCTPDVHYGLVCSRGHEWDEPCSPGNFRCPECGEEVRVTWEEHQAWERDVLGIKE
jgi:hypothetical protein